MERACPRCAATLTADLRTGLPPSACPACGAVIDLTALHADSPLFSSKPAPPVHSSRREWVIVVLLAVAFLLVSFLADRVALANDARTRPLAVAVCNVLRCTLPTWREPAAFHLLQRDVQSLADRPGVLRINAAFRNEARWPQAWPVLEVALSDSRGRVIAMRAFTPADYLGKAPETPLVGPGEGASIALDVVEPQTPAVAYDFRLR